MASLILGGVTFQGFEIPDVLPFGSMQKAIPHQMIGGARIVDAMGPVPAPIRWQGRFRGNSALARAQMLNAMCQAGAQLPLIWSGVFYTVLIVHFAAHAMKSYEIPYEIDLLVVNDPITAAAGFAAAALSSLDTLVAGDMASLSSSLGSVNLGF